MLPNAMSCKLDIAHLSSIWSKIQTYASIYQINLECLAVLGICIWLNLFCLPWPISTCSHMHSYMQVFTYTKASFRLLAILKKVCTDIKLICIRLKHSLIVEGKIAIMKNPLHMHRSICKGFFLSR